MVYSVVNNSNDTDSTCAALTLFTTMVSTMLTSSLENSPYNQVCQGQLNMFIYDFVVVGSGTSGSVLASRLTEDPSWRVFVLEAGSEEVPLMDVPSLAGISNQRFFWNLTAKTSTVGGYQPIVSAKTLGGTSSINHHMMYIRGNRRNFDQWASMGNTGWDYDSVLPYFKKSENNLSPYLADDKTYHNTGGPLSVSVPEVLLKDTQAAAFLDAFQTIGLSSVDYNAADQIGASVPQFNLQNGVRQSTNTAFLEPARSRKNLVLKTNCQATKIVLDPFTKKALGVKYTDENGTPQIVYARKEIIISAGVYHSAQLLMLSGIGPKSDLIALNIPVVNDLPVGKRVQDQVGIDDVFTFSVPPRPSSSPLEVKIGEWNLYTKNHTGPLSVPSGIITAFQSFGQYPSMSDVQHVVYRKFSDSDCPDVQYESTFYNKLVLVPSLVNPRSVGQITLKDSDPLSEPVIDSGILEDPEDKRVLVESLKVLYNISRLEFLKQNNIKFDGLNVPACNSFLSDATMDSYWNCVVQQKSRIGSHATSSCPMGPRDYKFAVVDPKLQVYGVQNLRVIGSPVMPTMISGNTVASSVMIAEKCADFIKKDWQ